MISFKTFLNIETADKNSLNELQEIYRMSSVNNISTKKDINDYIKYSRVQKIAKPLPGGSGLLYSVDQKTKEIVISILDPTTEEVVGYLQTKADNKEKYFPIKNAHSVYMIAVDPERRGQGIAKSLYGIYLSILKYPLLSGIHQTAGGRKNWLSLTKIPGVTIKGYVLIEDRFGKNENKSEVFNKFVDSIIAMGGKNIGVAASGRLKYYSFDVEQSSSELRPAVKKQLQLYNNNIYPFYQEIGLYAVWGGK